MVQIVGRGFVLGPRQFVLGIPMSSRFLVLGVGMRMKTLVFIVMSVGDFGDYGGFHSIGNTNSISIPASD